MIDLSCLAEFATLAKDIVLTVAGAIGAYVALRGLSTWNRQLKGGVEYELTRRLLKQTYRLREALKGIRNPVMWGGEMPSPPEGTRDAMNKAMRKNRDVLYEISGEEEDEFASDISKTICSIESFLKPYLRK